MNINFPALYSHFKPKGSRFPLNGVLQPIFFKNNHPLESDERHVVVHSAHAPLHVTLEPRFHLRRLVKQVLTSRHGPLKQKQNNISI